MTDQDKNQTIAQRNRAMNPNMTLACPAYLHGFVLVQDLQDWKLVEDVKALEKTTYTSLINHKEQEMTNIDKSQTIAQRNQAMEIT